MGRKRMKDLTRLPPFVALPWEILNSRAFKTMKHSSRSALPYFMGKPKVPFNQRAYISTPFEFSYPEALRAGFARSTFSGTIKELIKHGFIDPVDKGGLRGHGKSCSLFKLSRRWERFGRADFEHISWEEFQPKKRDVA